MKGAVVIIPFHLTWSWQADFMRQTAQVLSKDNIVICYLTHEHIRFRSLIHWSIPTSPVVRASKQLWLVRPVFFIPFERFESVRIGNHAINLIILQILLSIRFGFTRRKVFWVFDKTLVFMLRVIHGYFIVYDCVDYVWHPVKTVYKYLKKQEDVLILSADVMIVNSHVLYDRHKSKRKDIHIVPLGFRLHDYNKIRLRNITFPNDKPLIGYTGVIDYRFDFSLLYGLIKHNFQWRFVLWGPIQTNVPVGMMPIDDWLEKIYQLPNVIFGMSRNPIDVQSVIKQFSVCILPYDTSLPIVRHSYPMKVFEYFYAGKPVVSTDIVELRRYLEFVCIGTTQDQWNSTISSLLASRWRKKKVQQQKNIARKNSWVKKIYAVYDAIDGYGE